MKKRIAAILVIAIILSGVCGCMDQTDMRQLEQELLAYAKETYGGSFTVRDSHEAADNTQTDMVTLEDEAGLLFNVYRQPSDGMIYDDYAEVIVDQKIAAHLRAHPLFAETGAELGVMCVMLFDYDVQMLREMSLEECLSQYELVNLITVVRFRGGRGTIKAHADALADFSQQLRQLGSANIKYQVVVNDKEDAQLDQVLANMRACYDGSWYVFDSICETVNQFDPDFHDGSDIIPLIKEG